MDRVLDTNSREYADREYMEEWGPYKDFIARCEKRLEEERHAKEERICNHER